MLVLLTSDVHTPTHPHRKDANKIKPKIKLLFPGTKEVNS